MISSNDCFSSDASVAAEGLKRSARVHAIVKACESAVLAGTAEFDLAVLPRRRLNVLAAAPTLPLTLAHSIEYTCAVRAAVVAGESLRGVLSEAGAAMPMPPSHQLLGSGIFTAVTGARRTEALACCAGALAFISPPPPTPCS